MRLVRRPTKEPSSSPLLVELLPREGGHGELATDSFPFAHSITERSGRNFYVVSLLLDNNELSALSRAVSLASAQLDPEEVVPLTFGRLVEVLSQLAAQDLARRGSLARTRELSELAAYEAIGLSRILALAKDESVTEFFADSDDSSVYLDHSVAGRCETGILLNERERLAIATHLDTFGGYTADFRTPSLKNDIRISDALLRVSLDLEPLSVNRFALDVRRLNVTTMDLKHLIGLGVLSASAAGFLVGWLESGGNVTILGETGSGKTTLLNALDEELDPRLRRVYIEDSVETKDLISRGYHQMKLKVDPFDRGGSPQRTKGAEIVKALHRSPDMVILSEIQSEEHSRAFFHSLAAGVRGMQTFHASTVEQAIGRWVNIHRIPKESLLDLGLLVQMARPDKLGQARFVQRVCAVVADSGIPRVRDLFLRDRWFNLIAASDYRAVPLPTGDPTKLSSRVDEATSKFARKLQA